MAEFLMRAMNRFPSGATTERNALVQECFKRGLLVLGAGRNAIRLSPPLVFSKQHADTAIEILDQALGTIAPRQ